MDSPTYQHAPAATRPPTNVHHTTASTSHRAFPRCCQAGPFGSQYLTPPTSSPSGRTRWFMITMHAGVEVRVRRNTSGEKGSLAALTIGSASSRENRGKYG